MNTDAVILRFRRDLTISATVRIGLMIAMLIVALAGPVIGIGAMSGAIVAFILLLWMFLQARSLQRTQQAAGSTALIAAGQFDQAEQSIAQSLRGFTLGANVKLLSLHHLALLRQAQDRHPETAQLCHALLERPRKALGDLEKPTRLLLAGSMLKLNDLPGAHQALMGLYTQRLDLGQAMELLVIELEYQARTGDWSRMLHNAASKIDLAEVMPTEKAALTQAFLALAAKENGLSDLADWLKRRVELLCDTRSLAKNHPVLEPLFV